MPTTVGVTFTAMSAGVNREHHSYNWLKICKTTLLGSSLSNPLGLRVKASRLSSKCGQPHSRLAVPTNPHSLLTMRPGLPPLYGVSLGVVFFGLVTLIREIAISFKVRSCFP